MPEARSLKPEVRSPKSEARSPKPHSGMVLLVVVIIMALLTLAGFAFVALMNSELATTRQRGREIQVQYVTQSGVSLIESIAVQSDFDRKNIGGTYDNASHFCAVPIARDVFDPEPKGRVTIVSPKIDNGRMVGIRYGLVNESAKLHLAKVLEWETANPGDGVAALRRLPGMTAQTAEAILDWIDADDTPRISGAEANDYTRMRLPYKPRNAVPVTLEEFLLVRGVTRQLMFGDDENFNFVPDTQETRMAAQAAQMPNDPTSSNMPGNNISSQPAPQIPANIGTTGGNTLGSSTPAIPWVHLLTVTGAERDANPRGAARIDLNAPNLEFLHTQLTERIDGEVADFVILYRQFGPAPKDAVSTTTSNAATSIADSATSTTAATIAATTAGNNSGSTSGNRSSNASRRNRQTRFSAYVNLQTPAKFRLETPLDVVNAVVGIPQQNANASNTAAASQTATTSSTADSSTTATVAQTPPMTTLESPFSVDSSSLNSTLVTYLDEVSTSPSTTMIGRININEAPYEVLAGIPGLSQNAAQQIVNRREQPANGVRDMYRHPTWLLAFDVVDLETLKKLWPDITCGGDVFRGQVIGFYEDIGTFLRVETTVDATVFPPRRIDYKDLSSYGIGFHDRVLFGTIAQQGTAGGIVQPNAPTLGELGGMDSSLADWNTGAYPASDSGFGSDFGIPGAQPMPQQPFAQPSYGDIAPLDAPRD